MTIRFRCEVCSNIIKAPDKLAGKMGKCPACGATVYIPHSGAVVGQVKGTVPAPTERPTAITGQSTATGTSPESLVACPDCGNQISRKAPACVHCGCPMGPKFADEPSTVSAEEVRKGTQSAMFNTTMGCLLAIVGIPVAAVVGLATQSFGVFIFVAIALVSLGIVVASGVKLGS